MKGASRGEGQAVVLGLLPLNEPQNFHGTWGLRSLWRAAKPTSIQTLILSPQQRAGVQEAAVKVCTRMEHSPPFLSAVMAFPNISLTSNTSWHSGTFP